MEQSVENHSTIVNRAEIIFQTGEFRFSRFKDASLFRYVAFKRKKETRLLLFMLRDSFQFGSSFERGGNSIQPRLYGSLRIKMRGKMSEIKEIEGKEGEGRI